MKRIKKKYFSLWRKKSGSKINQTKLNPSLDKKGHHSFAIIYALILLISGACEKGSRGGKAALILREANLKTSQFGACDYQSECWDYMGTDFKTEFEAQNLKHQCESSGGLFSFKGCSKENRIGFCKIQEGSTKETVVHFYLKSDLEKSDLIPLCESQSGKWTDMF